MFVLLCAFAFSCHILVVDYFAPKCDGIKLSCIQFLTAGIIGIVCMLIFESPVIADILDCWLPILYCGVFSSGIAYTLQVLGQEHAEPSVASLILSLESVFAVSFRCTADWRIIDPLRRNRLRCHFHCCHHFTASIKRRKIATKEQLVYNRDYLQ